MHLESDPGWFLEPLRTRLRANGFRVAYAVLRAPLAVCRQRCANRDSGRLADPAVVEQIWREFTDIGTYVREPHFGVDSEGGDPVQRCDHPHRNDH